MKNPKAEGQPKAAVEAVAAIAEIVLQFRGDEKPTLSDIARITGRPSGLLRVQDMDQKITVENAATV
jgi:hypothetical protein